MTERSSKRLFAVRPSDPDAWGRKPEPSALPRSHAERFTARLTIDVTPALRGRIKIAFQRARFAPGSVFAFIRWASNDFGTVVSRVDIVRAVSSGEPYQTLPFVRPGGEILLRISGWPKVEHVLQEIDAVEALGIDAADAAPDHWRHVHNRLVAGEPARRYSLDQHRAWLLRRRTTA